MKNIIRSKLLVILAVILINSFSGISYGHGLMLNPPARNAVCGLPEDQKPHNASIPACIDAFAVDNQGGYQFMSVLTHDVGRQGVTPLPTNVCGFNSETWDNYNNGNTTPWDLALDWPTTDVSSGALDIT
jgi:chitin-binding protein